MRPWISVLLVAFGGALGAVARHAANEFCHRWIEGKLGRFWPLSTLLVNVVGCFAIGFLMAMFRRGELSEGWRLLFVTGGLGALTTFSSFSFETLMLARDDTFALATLNTAANVLLCLLAVWLGWWLGGGK
ncbi:MAG: fluoride efflux transporter CrcB [Planctomycetes bacterium]|nr:fluoride efflux transporter CrcB [Planctomycetota bacterium]